MFSTQVSNGATLLDSEVPAWYRRTNVSLLNIADPRNCTLAQLHGNYFVGLAAHTEDEPPRSWLGRLLFAIREWMFPSRRTRWAIAHGFTIRDSGDPEVNQRRYATLTRAWTAAILERRAMDERERETETADTDNAESLDDQLITV